MAVSTNEAQIKLTAKDAASGVVANAARNVKKELTGLNKLKASFGEESALGGSFKLLKGAGAIAGLTMGANALKDMTGKAVELRDALNAGKISTVDLTEQLIQTVPVIGQMYEAAKSIDELITGRAAAVAAFRESAKLEMESGRARVELERTINEAAKSQRDTYKEIVQEMRLALATAEERAKLEAQAARDRREQQVRDEAEAQRAKVNAASRAAEQAALERLSKASQKLAAAEDATGFLGLGFADPGKVNAAVAEERAAKAALRELRAERERALADIAAAEQRNRGAMTGSALAQFGAGVFGNITRQREQASQQQATGALAGILSRIGGITGGAAGLLGGAPSGKQIGGAIADLIKSVAPEAKAEAARRGTAELVTGPGGALAAKAREEAMLSRPDVGKEQLAEAKKQTTKLGEIARGIAKLLNLPDAATVASALP